MLVSAIGTNFTNTKTNFGNVQMPKNQFDGLIPENYFQQSQYVKDGIDEGKISAGLKIKNFAKGAWEGIKENFQTHPVKNALMIGGLLIPGVRTIILAVKGIQFAFRLAKGMKNVQQSRTDTQAEAAWQNTGHMMFNKDYYKEQKVK